MVSVTLHSDMLWNKKLDREFSIKIGTASYPVKVSGSGKINCFIVGIGTSMLRTLSERFREIFTIYSMDLYWTENQIHPNPSEFSIQESVDDIFYAIKELNLKDVVLIGHSAFGLVALEAAKEYSPLVKTVLMRGTPTASNPDIAEEANECFELHASEGRKENDKERKQLYQKVKSNSDSAVSFAPYVSQSARYWGDFNVSNEFLEDLWHGIHVEPRLMQNFFSKLLPEYNFTKNIKAINIPVALVAGTQDYDCIPLVLWKKVDLPKDFKMINCGDVGHWPQIECPIIFDEAVAEWVKSLNLGE